jgi:hypothetical protein
VTFSAVAFLAEGTCFTSMSTMPDAPPKTMRQTSFSSGLTSCFGMSKRWGGGPGALVLDRGLQVWGRGGRGGRRLASTEQERVSQTSRR